MTDDELRDHLAGDHGYVGAIRPGVLGLGELHDQDHATGHHIAAPHSHEGGEA